MLELTIEAYLGNCSGRAEVLDSRRRWSEERVFEAETGMWVINLHYVMSVGA